MDDGVLCDDTEFGRIGFDNFELHGPHASSY